MCGRFTLFVDPAGLLELFPWLELPGQWTPRYNVAPSQPVAAVPNDGQNRVDFFHWGLIPFWAKEPQIGSRMINARAETLAEKPSFKAAYRRRRCLVLADGFYEWRKEPGQRGKTPFYIHLESRDPFAFAGLWETWRAPGDAVIRSCTIITTAPNELVAPIHNRMPVILDPAAYELWLDPVEREPNELQEWLRPYPAEQMAAYAVSAQVNDPGNDSPDCVRPIVAPPCGG
ncbi:MAG: SOS response-associated peptidase [Anaerolineae bacterium]|nr:SOS response-associated peptidase [Anaerolineae bacterium]